MLQMGNVAMGGLRSEHCPHTVRQEQAQQSFS